MSATGPRSYKSFVESEQRTCFGIAWFSNEADAEAYAEEVRKAGLRYNGGMYHGMRCGRADWFDLKPLGDEPALYAVTD
jgi:hypothetical protein